MEKTREGGKKSGTQDEKNQSDRECSSAMRLLTSPHPTPPPLPQTPDPWLPHMEVGSGGGDPLVPSQALSQPVRMPWAGTGQVIGQMKAAIPSRHQSFSLVQSPFQILPAPSPRELSLHQ